jgi:ketosteroid isomerase-like protein
MMLAATIPFPIGDNRSMMNLLKRNQIQPLLLALGVLLAPSTSAVAACSTSPADAARVVDAVKTFFVAAATDDVAKFHSVAAPGFYAFDGGKRFNGDELMNRAKQMHAAGKIYAWTVTEPEVHVNCDTAWITYVNRGSIHDQSGKHDLTWLESADLEKVGGRWRIRFLESERAQ